MGSIQSYIYIFFSQFNAQMKEDIFAMNAEAEGHQSAIVRIQHDLAVLRGNVNYNFQTRSGIFRNIFQSSHLLHRTTYRSLTVDSVVGFLLERWSEDSSAQKVNFHFVSYGCAYFIYDEK